MERGDTGLGRAAYGLPRQPRPGDRRVYRADHGTPGADAGGVRGPEDVEDDEYGHLLRRPGDLPQQWPRQPGRSRTRQPGRFSPSEDSLPPNGAPADGAVNGGPSSEGLPNARPANGGPASGRPANGRQYRAPNGQRVPPDADRGYRPQAPGRANGTHGQPGGPGHYPPGGSWERPYRPAANAGPRPGAGGGPRAYGVPAGAAPGASRFAGASESAGGRAEGRQGWGRLGAQPPRGAAYPDPGGSAGPVIRQRGNAVPGEQPADATHAAVSIAPDGLESFARDLRTLRATAELDYPEMAELSHYTMKTLASAAGGLRLPTLPVAVAYVRACGGNVTEWEERWQKLAAKITTGAAKKRRDDGDEHEVIPEPAELSALSELSAPSEPSARAEPSAPPAAQDPADEPGEVYIITSARPPKGAWRDGPPGSGTAPGGRPPGAVPHG